MAALLVKEIFITFLDRISVGTWLIKCSLYVYVKKLRGYGMGDTGLNFKSGSLCMIIIFM